MRYRIAYLFCLTGLFLIGCENGYEEAESELIRFMIAPEGHDAFDEYPRADTLFCSSVPFPKESNQLLVYVMDGGCSICIAEAIRCLKAFLRIKKDDEKFFFLIESRYTDILSYYLEKEVVPSDNYWVYQIEQVERKNQGVYCVKNNKVVNYLQWHWL